MSESLGKVHWNTTVVNLGQPSVYIEVSLHMHVRKDIPYTCMYGVECIRQNCFCCTK